MSADPYKRTVRPVTDTSTPEKWAAHQATIQGQRDDKLAMKKWTVVRVVRQEFVVLAETRERCLDVIAAGMHLGGPSTVQLAAMLSFKEAIETQQMQSSDV